MNLHEYQAKQLFRDYGIAVSDGVAASSAEQAEDAALSLGVSKWVVKAQVHAGGRGKAGGATWSKRGSRVGGREGTGECERKARNGSRQGGRS